ncbi:uncharacterized protein BDR25DRAFT_348853 [Lindgomyces ingoldianus]|uniref:Uncharacterized protein n=1 Tax=Lindgomyces ingoldianus TaxID=673940 RepID=A0ACB6RD15_9PLEO|nr:uncharacterized protein BDR25DRAFT_348853 [Lindgomyces ingoldianus]KAF2476940.1 hypothetical protein BDR25DRAFT_348853 [Lindgomyces ingoldianus]
MTINGWDKVVGVFRRTHLLALCIASAGILCGALCCADALLIFPCKAMLFPSSAIIPQPFLCIHGSGWIKSLVLGKVAFEFRIS